MTSFETAMEPLLSHITRLLQNDQTVQRVLITSPRRGGGAEELSRWIFEQVRENVTSLSFHCIDEIPQEPLASWPSGHPLLICCEGVIESGLPRFTLQDELPVLLVIQARVTARHETVQSVQILKDAKVDLIGTVLGNQETPVTNLIRWVPRVLRRLVGLEGMSL